MQKKLKYLLLCSSRRTGYIPSIVSIRIMRYLQGDIKLLCLSQFRCKDVPHVSKDNRTGQNVPKLVDTGLSVLKFLARILALPTRIFINWTLSICIRYRPMSSPKTWTPSYTSYPPAFAYLRHVHLQHLHPNSSLLFLPHTPRTHLQRCSLSDTIFTHSAL